jgi:hypothetical protein
MEAPQALDKGQAADVTQFRLVTENLVQAVARDAADEVM